MSVVRFDGVRSLEDLARLEQIGDRSTGGRGAGKARSLIRREARRAGFDARDVDTTIEIAGDDGQLETRTATHVVARREGASSDVILIVAPYDTPAAPIPEIDDEAGAGAGVLLGLARVDRTLRDAVGEQPFTLVLAFVDGDGQGSRAPGDEPGLAFPGSDAFARWWLAENDAADARLVVWIDRVGASQVEVARDLHSNRVYREAFFAIGVERALQPTFTAARPLSAPTGGHRALQARGFSPVVALVGDGSAAFEREGASAFDESSMTGGPGAVAFEAGAAVASLEAVGEVTWRGVVQISDRLARIDAFRVDPLEGGPGWLELPGAGEGSQATTDGEERAGQSSEGRQRRTEQARDEAPASPR